MKVLAALLSIATGIYVYSLAALDASLSQGKVNINELERIDNIAQPGELLPIEKDWARKEPPKKIAKPKTQKTTENKESTNKSELPTLDIAGVKYRLKGIFTNLEKPFIILQDPKNTLLKVNQGDDISKGNTLLQVFPDRISIKSNNKAIEFKLFEINKNA